MGWPPPFRILLVLTLLTAAINSLGKQRSWGKYSAVLVKQIGSSSYIDFFCGKTECHRAPVANICNFAIKVRLCLINFSCSII